MGKQVYYTIYQITNKINGKIYVGKHITHNPYDDYYGSGVIIQRAIEKYGKENFAKDVLFIFDNQVEMERKEREIVDEDFIRREDTYNLVLGGHGGGRVPGYVASPETRKKISAGVQQHNKEHPSTDEYRQKLSRIRKQRFIDHPELHAEFAATSRKTWTDPQVRQRRIEGQKRWHKEVGLSEEQLNKLRVPHSPEWSQKISSALKGKAKSLEHRKRLSEARKGRIRVYNPTTQKWKYIKPTDPIPEGFARVPVSMTKRH